MKIVFHGANAANFRSGIETLLDGRHDIVDLGDALAEPGDRAHFESAEVIVGVALGPAHPSPARLRLYQAPAAGLDAIDVARLPPGAALCNAFGHEHAIAEYVMAALLARHVPIAAADRRLREGRWDYRAGRPGALRTELGARTLGLLGYGHIGKAIAVRAKAFGMRVVVANRTIVPPDDVVAESFGLDNLAAFMGSADVVVVSLPLTPDTRGAVGRRELEAMRPDGVIVNVGRGPVIDEGALYGVLRDKRIGGAIVDTWYTYPGPDNAAPFPASFPFHELANVVMTPHMSGWTDGTVSRRRQTIADNVGRLARNEPLLNRLI